MEGKKRFEERKREMLPGERVEQRVSMSISTENEKLGEEQTGDMHMTCISICPKHSDACKEVEPRINDTRRKIVGIEHGSEMARRVGCRPWKDPMNRIFGHQMSIHKLTLTASPCP